MTIADATWIATALLHKENDAALDFSVQEIADKARREKLVDGFRPGLKTHASQHCVANKVPNPAKHRMLFKTANGRRRLFKQRIDSFHPDREEGKVRPEKTDIPAQYQDLIDWYDSVFATAHSEKHASTITNDENLKEHPEQYRNVPEVDTLLSVLTKPLFANSAGDLVIPKNVMNNLGIKLGASYSIRREDDHIVLQPITEDYISSLVGSLRGVLKGGPSLLEIREREHRFER